jgi:hypothetical protein
LQLHSAGSKNAIVKYVATLNDTAYNAIIPTYSRINYVLALRDLKYRMFKNKRNQWKMNILLQPIIFLSISIIIKYKKSVLSSRKNIHC